MIARRSVDHLLPYYLHSESSQKCEVMSKGNLSCSDVASVLSDDAWQTTLGPIREAVSFTSEHARLAGDLIPAH